MTTETMVFDLTTGQWAQWQTIPQGADPVPESAVWDVIYGTFWRELDGSTGQDSYASVGAGYSSNAIYRIDPTVETDDNAEGTAAYFERIVTGLLSTRGRVFIRQFNLTLTASAGDPAMSGAVVSMRFSDDNGNTWISMPDITLTAGAYNQLLQWRSLGIIRSPNRLFEISDTGGLVRIADTRADLEAEEA